MYVQAGSEMDIVLAIELDVILPEIGLRVTVLRVIAQAAKQEVAQNITCELAIKRKEYVGVVAAGSVQLIVNPIRAEGKMMLSFDPIDVIRDLQRIVDKVPGLQVPQPTLKSLPTEK